MKGAALLHASVRFALTCGYLMHSCVDPWALRGVKTFRPYIGCREVLAKLPLHTGASSGYIFRDLFVSHASLAR